MNYQLPDHFEVAQLQDYLEALAALDADIRELHEHTVPQLEADVNLLQRRHAQAQNAADRETAEQLLRRGQELFIEVEEVLAALVVERKALQEEVLAQMQASAQLPEGLVGSKVRLSQDEEGWVREANVGTVVGEHGTQGYLVLTFSSVLKSGKLSKRARIEAVALRDSTALPLAA